MKTERSKMYVYINIHDSNFFFMMDMLLLNTLLWKNSSIEIYHVNIILTSLQKLYICFLLVLPL